MRWVPWAVAAITVGAVVIAVKVGRYFTPSMPAATPIIVDMTGAVVACERAAADYYPPGSMRVMVDDHSSRFDRRTRRYHIFMEAQTVGGTPAERYYINCFVAPHNGVVARFESLKDSDGAPAGGRQFWIR